MKNSQTKTDREVDAAISQLYRATRDAAPSVELDAKIILEAQSAARRHRRRWLLPLSSAAVLLLGLTLTLRLVDQPPALDPPVEDVELELPAKTEVLPRAENKQFIAEPAMMMDPIPRPTKQEGGVLQKMAPRSSTPTFNEEQYSKETTRFEAPEGVDQVVQSIDMEEDPAVWLARIENNLLRGERAKAIQDLQAFILSYPEYPLPKTLQELELD